MPIDPAAVQWDSSAPASPIDPAHVQWEGGAPPGASKPAPHVLGPWASAFVRPAAEGVAVYPLMAMDAGVAARNLGGDLANKALGRPPTPDYELPSQMFQQALDRYTSKPRGVGKAAEFVNSVLAGGFINPEGVGIRAIDAIPGKALAEPGAREAILREAQQVGYRIPPSERASLLAKGGEQLEGISSKAALARTLTADNQKVTDRLAKTALGLPDDGKDLTEASIEQVREHAASAYDQVAQLGDIRTDDQMLDDLTAVGSEFSKIDRAFPNEPGIAPSEAGGVDASRIEAVKGKYLQPQFTAREAIDAMRTLRKQAATNLKVYDPEKNALGLVQRQISDAFEARLERAADEANRPDLLAQFRTARKRIAQTYVVQNAFNEATGHVSAGKIAQQGAAGAPLTDELQTIARAQQTFPRVMRDSDKLGGEPMFSVVDFLAAAGGYLHSPSLALAILARPALRAGLRQASRSPIGRGPSPATAAAVERLGRAAPGMAAAGVLDQGGP